MTNRPHLALCSAALALSAIGQTAFGADSGVNAAAQSRYEKDRAACISGKTHQDRATCLKEAGAALDASKRGKLSEASTQYRKNALLRCDNVPERDRADCRARIDGDSTTTSGDALEGGILRERVTPVPGPAPTNPQ